MFEGTSVQLGLKGRQLEHSEFFSFDTGPLNAQTNFCCHFGNGPFDGNVPVSQAWYSLNFTKGCVHLCPPLIIF